MCRTFVLPLVVCLLPVVGRAAEGVVQTPDGQPVPQVSVTLRGEAATATALTGTDGRFRFDLPAGRYDVAVDAPGFVLSQPQLTVTGGGRAEIVLAPAPVREHVVVAATRSAAVASALGIPTSTMTGDEIALREPAALVDVLQEIPGLTTTRSGAVGTQASVLLRGGASNFTRVLVDGVPVHEPGGAFDYGAVPLLAIERLEVVRGAASSLYGSDAASGVVHIVTRRASLQPGIGYHVEGEGGQNSWRRLAGGTSGRSDRLDWNVVGGRLETDNELPNNAFEQSAGAATVGLELGDAATARLFGRGERSSVGTPGQTAFGAGDLDASFDRRNVVTGLELNLGAAAVHHLVRIGHARSKQLSLNPEASAPYTPRFGDKDAGFSISDFPAAPYRNDTRRTSATYQADAHLHERHFVSAGVDFERETGILGYEGGADQIRPTRNNVGAFVQDRLVLGSAFLTAGARLEHNASFGTRLVPRAAVAWRVRGGADDTTLRASAGLGVKEPSFLDSFSQSDFAKGNPDLRPERSRTIDAGVMQRFAGGRARVDAGVFDHLYRDQISFQVVTFDPFVGTFLNLGESRARGAELSVEAVPVTALSLRGQYTFTDSQIDESAADFDPVYKEGEALLRRPRHQGSVAADLTRGRLRAGATVVRVGRRVDSDFLGLGLTSNDAYTRVDARLHLGLLNGVEGFVVAQNLLDRSYMEVLGYPALGRAVRAGVRYTGGTERR